MIDAVVIDTNVLLVANEKAEQASLQCARKCLEELRQVQQGKKIICIDDRYRILREYQNKCNPSGQPGPGDAFLKWLWRNHPNPECCEQVKITPKDDDPNDFEEFPGNPQLANFDRSDRKFVAVARASQYEPAIVNAADTDWFNYQTALEGCGIKINFLCPELMQN